MADVPNIRDFYSKVLVNNTLFYPHQFLIKFEGFVGNNPGGTNDLPGEFDPVVPAEYDFTYYVKSAKIPKIEVNESTVNFLSRDFVVPNVVKQGGTWDVKFTNRNDLAHWKSFREWLSKFSNSGNGLGNGNGSKTVPNTTAKVMLLDSSMTSVKNTFYLEGIFPSKLPDLDLAYEANSTIVDVNVTFTYQYMYEENDGEKL